MEETAVYTEKQIRRYDPTQTTGLRNIFAKDMQRRFTEFAVVVKKSIYNNDCFGLKDLQKNQMQPVSEEEYKYKTSAEKIALFLLWAQVQIDRGILSIGGFQDPWANKYVYEAYRSGVIRAHQELIKAGYKIPTIEEMGGIDVVLQGISHAERLELLYSGTFTNLKGVTDAMNAQISKILTQGFLNGEAPIVIARKLVATINGTGMGELGITDTLGRFIPAARRAEMIARTEIIKAHHLATIQEYRNWGLEGIKVLAEWSSARDGKVCDKCLAMDGKVFTLDEIESLIPFHPSCRCTTVPYIEELQKYK